MNILYRKFKEVFKAILPIVAMVLLLDLCLIDLAEGLLPRFLLGALMIFLGLSIFLFGVENGITPIGNELGTRLTRSGRLPLTLGAGAALGFIISMAEPDLHILADQVTLVTGGILEKWTLVIVVSLGIALMLSLGIFRILRGIPLYLLLMGLYGVILLLSVLVPPEFLAIAFDSSGATTGAMTVPFIMAISIGISSLKKNSLASEKDSLGMVAIVSAGAIIGVLLLGILSGDGLLANVPEMAEAGAAHGAGMLFQKVAFEIFLALLPILLIFLVFLPDPSVNLYRRHLFGLGYTYIGLVLFLFGVNYGFMDVGRVVGEQVASLGLPWLLVLVGFLLGLVTILAEPAVYVLTDEIDDITSGYVPRRFILMTLSLGVGLAVALAMLRIVIPGLDIWRILLPGYLIALALTIFVPKIFVGIAFDAGGVASGPMNATFILAFTQGAAGAAGNGDVLMNGFGLITMVAMTPLIALQILGLIFKIKVKKEGLLQWKNTANQ